MTRDIVFDDNELWSMLSELDEKHRLRALKGALGASARAVRKTAVKNFRGSGIRTSKYSEKGIRAVISKHSLYYRVTVGTARDRTNYSRMSSLETKTLKALRRKEIIPLWMEGGTKPRSTRGIGFTRKGSRFTGELLPRWFMEKTRVQEEGRQTENLRQNLEKYILKTVTRHGCTIK